MTSYILKGVSILTRPVTKLGEFVMETIVGEDHSRDSDSEGQPLSDGPEPLTLEGTLSYRKGGGAGKSLTWQKRYVVLDMTEGGSLSCFRLHQAKPRVLRQMYSTLHRQMSSGSINLSRTYSGHSSDDVILHVPPHAPWIIKDVPDSSSLFVLEIETTDSGSFHFDRDESDDESETMSIAENSFVTNDFSDVSTSGEASILGDTVRSKLEKDLQKARKHNKPLRFYFKCFRKTNEKALWIKAFSKINRLSSEPSCKKKPLSALAKAFTGKKRIRTPTSSLFARETRVLDRTFASVRSPHLDIDDEHSPRPGSIGGTEFLVSPSYAYPHIWMTHEELQSETDLSSSCFHDLRLPDKGNGEIGTLRVEVLQCYGLPTQDRKSQTNGVAYLVCGSYAFATDTIKGHKSPMWLRKARRACIFPIFHAYARLYVGVFDDDPKDQDDFVGRIVLDLARLRPGSEYDVTLPLRLSAHVYSRRKRGSIRLRFQLDWKSERAALLSYLPKKIRWPRNCKPREDVTVLCADETSFQNVAITVHGAHPPGRFSINLFRSVLREISFTRKVTMLIIRRTIKDLTTWKKPSVSLLVFLAWMHACVANRFSLVPAYAASFVLLLMIRNYAKYGISRKEFLPPTWEELLFALLADTKTGEYQISPIEMNGDRGQVAKPGTKTQVMPALNETASDAMDDSLTTHYSVVTHDPEVRLLQLLGFLREADATTDTHLEFPFARNDDYPRFTVEESLGQSQQGKGRERRHSKAYKRKQSRDDTVNSSRDSVTQTVSIPVAQSNLTSEVLLSRELEELCRSDDDDSILDEDGTNTTGSQQPGSNEVPCTNMDHGLDSRRPSLDEFDAGEVDPCQLQQTSGEADGHQLPLYMQLPEQDIDKEGASSGKKLTDDLAEIKEKMHEMTCHLFNDKPYTVKDPDVLYFGHGNKAVSRKSSYNVHRYLDKSLSLGQYSHGNPILARIALYLEPIIGSAQSFLLAFRATCNVLTWRDPFLSFIAAACVAALATVLFVFPWHLFLFALGLVVVGPQNWLLRLLRENGTLKSKPERGPLSSSIVPTEDVDLPPEDFLHSQPVFQSHAPPDQKLKELDLSQVNPKEVHHVVVPYSPLMYQRFYDWPPEPQYARVKNTCKSRRKSVQSRSSTEKGSEGSSTLYKGRRFRNRSDGGPRRQLQLINEEEVTVFSNGSSDMGDTRSLVSATNGGQLSPVREQDLQKKYQ